MFHSSLIPLGFFSSLLVGFCTYFALHQYGYSPAESVAGAQTVTLIVNVIVGVPKNLIVGDILSLIFVRPISALATIALVGHCFGVSA